MTDDGLPRGSVVGVEWSVVSGPGPVTFADPHAVATAAGFVAPGVYTLRLTANDTEFTVFDELVITVLKNLPPTADAGPDRQITLPGTAALAGVVTDDGLPRGSILEASWSVVSGPGTVVFNDAFAAQTVANFAVAGTYVLRLTASDGQLSASDEMTVLVLPKPFTERTYTLDADFDRGRPRQRRPRHTAPATARRHDADLQLHLGRRLLQRHHRQDQHRDRRHHRRVFHLAAGPAAQPLAHHRRSERQRLGDEPRRQQRRPHRPRRERPVR